MAAWSFLNLLSNVWRAIKSLTVLPLPIQSCSALFLWLSDISGVRLSGLCLSLPSLSCSVLDTEAGLLPMSFGLPPASADGSPICPGLPLTACTWGMFPLTKGTRFGGTALFLRGLGLWRFSSGGSSGLGNPFGTGMPFACLPD